jgi:uncharacterized protein YndB with AHSA1/START domain
VELSLQHRIEQPVARVFALLSDPRQRPRWQASLSGVEMIDPGPPRVGMRWRERPGGLARFALAITELEAERRWAERFEGPASGSIALAFTPDGPRATRLEVRVAVDLRGPFKLLGPLLAQLLPLAIRADLARAERLLAGADP